MSYYNTGSKGKEDIGIGLGKGAEKSSMRAEYDNII
jgi:hypothetical protein